MYRNEKWRTATGEYIPVSMMSDTHLSNTLEFVKNKEKQAIGSGVPFGPDKSYEGKSWNVWFRIFRQEIKRRESAADLVPNSTGVNLEVKFIQYNAKNGITTVMFENGDIVMVKKAAGTKYCEYDAFTAAVTKYMFGSQRNVKKIVETTTTIKKKGQ